MLSCWIQDYTGLVSKAGADSCEDLDNYIDDVDDEEYDDDVFVPITRPDDDAITTDSQYASMPSSGSAPTSDRLILS